jgi:hypothetical protein
MHTLILVIGIMFTTISISFAHDVKELQPVSKYTSNKKLDKKTDPSLGGKKSSPKQKEDNKKAAEKKMVADVLEEGRRQMHPAENIKVDEEKKHRNTNHREPLLRFLVLLAGAAGHR